MQTTTRAGRRQTTAPRSRPPDPPDAPPPASSKRLYSAAASVGLAFIIGRILGQFREILIGAQFGTGFEKAAYDAAFRLPDTIFLLVMSGAFGSAFVPVFAGYLSQGQVRKAWRLASNVLTLMVEGYAAFALVAFIFAGPLVRWVIAPGFDQQTQALTIQLTRILLLSPLFLGLGAAAKSLLESHDNFTLPAYAPVVYNALGVFGAAFLVPRYGVKGLAWGIVAGSIAHVTLQLPGLARVRMRYIFLPRPVAEGVQRVGRLLGPRIIGQAAFQLNFFLIMTNYASRLGEAPTAALGYGYQLMMLPHGLLAISVSTVIFPLMSRLYVNRQFDELKTTFGDALRPLFFLTIPASVALMILARPIVQIIYQRGDFGPESTALVAGVLPYFAAGLVGLALVETSARAFFAMQDTRTPLIASLATIAINLVLALLLAQRFGARGLAASMSLTTTLEMLFLMIALRRRIGPFDVAVWTAFIKSLLATLVMTLVLLLIRDRLTAVTDPLISEGTLLGRLAIFGLALFIGLYTYLVAAWYLKTRELLELVARFGGRFQRLAGRRR
jgi:putative peptidoglycan lipid II flippase